MLRAIIIDDEDHCRNEIRTLLNNNKEIEIVAEGDSVKNGIDLIRTHLPDLIFLDIEMQDGTGFDLIDAFDKPNFQIVFTTGHNDYAVKAFKLSAVDYLLKPIDDQELINSIARAKFLQGKNDNFEKMGLLLKSLERKEFSKIAIPSMDSFEIIDKSEILYCEADSNYTIVQLAGAKKIMSTYTLKKMDELLSEEHFLRIHKSFLINVNYVVKVMKGSGELVMKNGDTIPVARRRKDRLMELMGI